MRKSLIAANWKMNGSLEKNKILLQAIIDNVDCELIIFPPAIYVQQVINLVGSSIKVGLQNVFFQQNGAFTGEISVLMAKDMGCTYTLIGHSERRQLFGETNEQIAKKMISLCDVGIIPVICVGETLEEREKKLTKIVIEQQLQSILDYFSGSYANLDVVIAYEPIWAIGTGVSANPEQANQVHFWIRQILKQYNLQLSLQTRILYGGSIKGDNARSLFVEQDIDGGLVGSASLDANEFLKICKSVG